MNEPIRDGMVQLGSGIASEVAYTGCRLSHGIGKVFRASCPMRGTGLTIVPVLTEKAIKSTGLVEHSQILISVLGSFGVGELRIARFSPAGADPVGNTIGGQRIIVPANHSLCSSPAEMEKLAFSILPQTAESFFALWDLALISTQTALDPNLIFRRLSRQVKITPGSHVCLLYEWTDLVKAIANTVQAHRQSL